GGDYRRQRRARIHKPRRSTGIFGRDIHRDCPHRTDRALGEEETAREAQRDDKHVVDIDDRPEPEERPGESDDGYYEPRETHIARALENPVGHDPAHGVPDRAYEIDHGRERRRAAVGEMESVFEEDG